MIRTFKWVLVPFAVFSLLGCGPEGSVSERLCEAADECNILEPGYNVDECTVDTDWCLMGQPDSLNKDWRREINRCLRMSSCSATFDCWERSPGGC